MFYDSNRQRIAYLVEVDGSEGKDFYHEILLYKEVYACIYKTYRFAMCCYLKV